MKILNIRMWKSSLPIRYSFNFIMNILSNLHWYFWCYYFICNKFSYKPLDSWINPASPPKKMQIFKSNFFFNRTENVIGSIIAEQGKNLISEPYGQKISTNYSKLGSNCEILINPKKVNFVSIESRVFFSDANFYSIEVSSMLIRT